MFDRDGGGGGVLQQVAAGVGTVAAEPADGRAARSYRTRLAIIDAMRALHADGDLRPTAPRIAERARVSLRTVWQHFADLETLLAEAARRDQEILLAMLEPIASDGPFAERVAQF